MKKILIALAVLSAVLLAALAVFAATFDLNRFRPMALKQIQSATGKEARIGRMGLTWKGGLAVRVDNIALFDAGDSEPDASLEHALVRVQLGPLLRKEVRVTGVWLSGASLVAERLADGSVSVAGIRPSAKSPNAAASAPSAPVAAAAAAFQIDAIRIDNAKIRYIDRSASQPMDIEISDLDAELKNVAPDKPVSFTARATVFGSKQNIAVAGRITPPAANAPALLEHFTLQADLSAIDLGALEASLPAAASAGLKAPLKGMLAAKIDRLVLDPAEMARAKAAVTLKDGVLTLAAVPLPLEDVSLEASLQSGSAEVSNLSARFAEGTLQFQGTINDLSGRADSSFRASVREVSVAKLARAASPKAPGLSGHLSLDFQGRAQGLSGAALTQTLSGQGRLGMKDGVLVNSNILRTVVQNLARIPGVGQAAIERIPPQYLAKIDEPHTVLRPFEAAFAVQQGRLFFDQLNVPTDLFVLSATGSIGFDKSIAMPAAIAFESGLSKALLSAAPPTQYFLNPATGQIEIRLTIQGTPPNVQVVPNLDAALQRVGQQVVTDLLQKKDPKEILSGILSGGVQQQAAQPSGQQPPGGGIPLEPASGATQTQQAQEPPSTEDQLVALLAGALNKNRQE